MSRGRERARWCGRGKRCCTLKLKKHCGAGRTSSWQNNHPWPASRRHLDCCLGTSGLDSWSNERLLCEIVRPDRHLISGRLILSTPRTSMITSIYPILLHRSKGLHSAFINIDFSFNPHHHSTRGIIYSILQMKKQTQQR